MNMRVAGPNGKSVEEENHDVDDHGRRSDGRQGLGADKAADHDGIPAFFMEAPRHRVLSAQP